MFSWFTFAVLPSPCTHNTDVSCCCFLCERSKDLLIEQRLYQLTLACTHPNKFSCLLSAHITKEKEAINGLDESYSQ